MPAATAYALGRFRAHTDFGPRADDFTGVVIGTETYRVDPDDALAHVAGDVMEATITGASTDLGTQHNRCVQP